MKIFTTWTGIIFLVSLWCNTAWGQSSISVIRCETTEAEEALRSKYPQIGTAEDFEEWLAPKVRRLQASSQSRSVITLPIIFHIIHDGEAEGTGDNVAAHFVYSQIEQLNNDFRRRSGTSGFNNHPDGADVEIEFCAAYFDTLGAPLNEPGIRRIDRNTMKWPAPPYSRTYVESFIKPYSQYDPDNYINVWVLDMESVNQDGTVLGYAQFPSMAGLDGIGDNPGLAETDGVAVAPFTIGSSTDPNTSGLHEYGKGRSLTHELGHFFGLKHIWGDGGCGKDDYCDDTPESDASNTGCDAGHVSCGTVDMIENYMDYSDDDCMNIFTQDQKARIITVLTNSPRRKTLANSTACLPLPQAAFAADKRIINYRETVSFTDQSSQNPLSWLWEFQGGSPESSTDQHPQVVYNTPGTYKVSLTVKNSSGEHTLSIDDFITVEDNLVCSGGVNTFPYNETLDGNIGLWTQSDEDDTDWTIHSGSTSTGSTGPEGAAQGSHYVYLEASGKANKTGIINSPCLNFTNLGSAELNFQYHMYGRTMGSLALQVSTDDGKNWSTIWSKSGDQSPQWRSEKVSLNAYAGLEWLQLRFLGTIGNAFLSDMALDNITISGVNKGPVAPTANFTASNTQINVGTSIQFTDISTDNPNSWEWEFEGGSPKNSTDQNPIVSYDTPGVYSVNLSVSNEVGSHSLTKTDYITVMDDGTAAKGCENGFQAFPYSESFENGLGGWTQGSMDNIDWTRLNKSTPSTATGPASAAEGEWYLYTEASGNVNRTATLNSPCFDFTGLVNAKFDFQYHMYGSNMGSLSLEASTDSGENWTELWTLTGDQGNEWHSASVNLEPLIGSMGVSFRFVGITGDRFRSDMAIDDVSITTSKGGTTPPPVADFEADRVSIEAGEKVNFSDLTSNNPTSWSWTFEGGNPASSTQQNPEVEYPKSGNFTVSLTVNNEGGNDIITKSAHITVIDVNKSCPNGINVFPHTESFEAETWSWTQDKNDDFDWVRNRLSTPSAATGPRSATDGGWYMYTESSLIYNETAILNSPCFDFSSVTSPSLSFEFHMLGQDMGSMAVEISANDGKNWKELWRFSGNQGDEWIPATIDLDDYAGEAGIKLRILGTTGSSYRSDMAIDNIRVHTAAKKANKINLNSKQSISRFAFAPNPARDQLRVHYESQYQQEAEIIVTDLLGRRLLSSVWYLDKGKNQNQLLIDSLENGSYFLVIRAGKDYQVKRFIKID